MTATGSGNGKKKTEVSDNKLFPQYSSNIDGSNIIDPEGIERLFNDLEISSHSIQANPSSSINSPQSKRMKNPSNPFTNFYLILLSMIEKIKK